MFLLSRVHFQGKKTLVMETKTNTLVFLNEPYIFLLLKLKLFHPLFIDLYN